MNDSEMNPMKTGLMFVPLGQAMSPGWPSASPRRDHLAELPAELEAAGGNGATAPASEPQTRARPTFGSLLERFAEFARRRRPATT